MIVANVRIDGVRAVPSDRMPITAGMIGAQVRIAYTDPIWDGLQKTVVFYGSATKDVITDDTVVAIPAEVLKKPNVPLVLGVYGVDADGCIVIPTLLAELGMVRVGANPSGDTTTNPTLPVWAQVQQLMTDLAEQSAGSAKDAQAAAEQSEESRDAAAESEEHSAASERAAKKSAAAADQSAKAAAASERAAKKSAAAADQSAKAAAASESGAALSANTASAEAQAAKGSADKAAQSQAAAQSALQGMVYVTFTVSANGHVLIRNGDLLGSTVFSLTPAGHLEVDY